VISGKVLGRTEYNQGWCSDRRVRGHDQGRHDRSHEPRMVCAAARSVAMPEANTRLDSHTARRSRSDIVDHCCDTWNKLINQPRTIMSNGLRDWVYG
jgi:hypothetical protein